MMRRVISVVGLVVALFGLLVACAIAAPASVLPLLLIVAFVVLGAVVALVSQSGRRNDGRRYVEETVERFAAIQARAGAFVDALVAAAGIGVVVLVWGNALDAPVLIFATVALLIVDYYLRFLYIMRGAHGDRR